MLKTNKVRIGLIYHAKSSSKTWGCPGAKEAIEKHVETS